MNKKHWLKLSTREGVDITTISGIDVVCYDLIWRFTKTKKELFFTYFYNKTTAQYIAIDPLALGQKLYKEYFDSVEKIKKYYYDGKKFLKQTEKKTRYWKNKLERGDKKLFLKAISDFASDFLKVNYNYSITPWIAIEAWQNDFLKIISELIEKNNLQSKREEIVVSANKPWKKTAINEIQEKLKRGENVKNLVREYQFLRSWSLIWYRPIDEAWVKAFKQTHSDYKQKYYSWKTLLKLLRPTRKERKILEIAPYMIFFKDWRDDLRRKHAYLWSSVFELIARKLAVDYFDLGYLTIEEIVESIKTNRVDKEKIFWRKNHPCVITAAGTDLKMKVVDRGLSKYQKIVKNLEEGEEKQTVQRIVKGIIAETGKIIGKVRIVKSYHDVKKVTDGDILVATTTHPNYISGMQRAAAFVTDEGGIACHAAIVARELKKPCIVGTKIATKVLKDGDLVEVDAEKGVVRILKK